MQTLADKKAIEINSRPAKLPLLRWHKWAKYNLSFQLSNCHNLQWKTSLLIWQGIKTQLPSFSNLLNRHQTKCHQVSRNRTLIHLHLWCQHSQAQLLFQLLCLKWIKIKCHHNHKWYHLNCLLWHRKRLTRVLHKWHLQLKMLLKWLLQIKWFHRVRLPTKVHFRRLLQSVHNQSKRCNQWAIWTTSPQVASLTSNRSQEVALPSWSNRDGQHLHLLKVWINKILRDLVLHLLKRWISKWLIRWVWVDSILQGMLLHNKDRVSRCSLVHSQPRWAAGHLRSVTHRSCLDQSHNQVPRPSNLVERKLLMRWPNSFRSTCSNRCSWLSSKASILTLSSRAINASCMRTSISKLVACDRSCMPTAESILWSNSFWEITTLKTWTWPKFSWKW